jgi:protein gp37
MPVTNRGNLRMAETSIEWTDATWNPVPVAPCSRLVALTAMR